MNLPTSSKELFYRTVAAFFERKLFIAVVTAVGIFATGFGTFLITPTWNAETRILVHQNPRQQMILFEDLQIPGQQAKDVNPANNLIEISRSRELAERIVRRFELDEAMRQRWENPEKLRDRIVVGAIKTVTFPLRLLTSLIAEPKPRDWTADAVDVFQNKIVTVKLVQDTEIIELTATGTSPQQATGLANTLAEMVVERTRDLDRNQAQLAADLTAESLHEAEEKLRASERALDLYRREHDVIDPAREQQLSLERLDKLQAELATERVDRDRLATQVRELERQLSGQEDRILLGRETSVNPLVTDFKKDLAALELQRAELAEDLTDEHPDMVSLSTRIQELRTKLAEEREMVLSSETTTLSPFYEQLMVEYQRILPVFRAADTHVAGLSAEINALQEELAALSRKTPGFAQAMREYQENLDLHNSLTGKLSELRVQSVSSMSEFDIKIFDAAKVSDLERPDNPKWLLNLAAGTLLSVFFALGLALALDYWRVSFKTAREIEAQLGIPVLATVPNAPRALRRRAR